MRLPVIDVGYAKSLAQQLSTDAFEALPIVAAFRHLGRERLARFGNKINQVLLLIDESDALGVRGHSPLVLLAMRVLTWRLLTPSTRAGVLGGGIVGSGVEKVVRLRL